MKKAKLYPKIAFDTFYEQFKWSLWFYAILTVAHIIGLYINSRNSGTLDEFFVFSSNSSSIFMLVCGIIAAYGFMAYYVQQGLSRKDTYFGIVIGAFGLSLAVTLIPLVLNGIELVIAGFTSLPLGTDSTTAFDLSSGWLSATVNYLLNVYTYYLIGWLVGVGYYRFGWLIGFGFVAFAIVAFSLNGFFVEDHGLSSLIPLVPNLPLEAAPIVAVVGSVILIAALLVSTRMLTKRIPIKM